MFYQSNSLFAIERPVIALVMSRRDVQEKQKLEFSITGLVW